MGMITLCLGLKSAWRVGGFLPRRKHWNQHTSSTAPRGPQQDPPPVGREGPAHIIDGPPGTPARSCLPPQPGPGHFCCCLLSEPQLRSTVGPRCLQLLSGQTGVLVPRPSPQQLALHSFVSVMEPSARGWMSVEAPVTSLELPAGCLCLPDPSLFEDPNPSGPGSRGTGTQACVCTC